MSRTVIRTASLILWLIFVATTVLMVGYAHRLISQVALWQQSVAQTEALLRQEREQISEWRTPTERRVGGMDDALKMLAQFQTTAQADMAESYTDLMTYLQQTETPETRWRVSIQEALRESRLELQQTRQQLDELRARVPETP